jgi:hypothetical protein
MNINSKVDLYIDPFINPINKSIIQKIEQFASRDGFRIVKNINELTNNSLPKVIIFEEDNNSRLNNLISNPENMAIQIEQPNLDMFSNQGILDNTYLITNESDFSGAYSLTHFHLECFLRRKKTNFWEASNTFYKKIMDDKINLETKDLTAQESQRLSLFEKTVYCSDGLEQINEELFKLASDIELCEMSLKNLSELLFDNITDNFLAVNRSQSELYFLTWNESRVDAKMMICYQILKSYFKLSYLRDLSKLELIEKDEHLSKFEFPIAIFDENEEILVHNSYFVDLNMSSKTCLNYKDNDQITINRVIYRIVVSTTQNNFLEYLFIPANDFLVGQENPTFEEMGIISSSVAHELNNPLAGVSAAIDYLLLDELDTSTKETILEMKKGVTKCRKLVKTFLSFSQVSQEKENSKIDLENCIGQSLELMRSRLIENNLIFSVDYKKATRLKSPANSDVFTMLFYLLFNDFVTNLSHHKLVSRQNNKKYCLNIVENSYKLTITLPEHKMLEKSFFDSKLVNHLFELVQMEYKCDQNTIEMISDKS